MSATVLLAAVLISSLLVAPARAAAITPEGPPVPFATIATGQSAGILQPTRLVIRDAVNWRALWRRHTGGATAAPAVDFRREMVVAIFAGTSAAPQVVTIASIVREPQRLSVRYAVLEKPLTDTDGLTPASAFHIVRLARSPLPVSFSLLKSFPAVPQP